MDGQNGGEDNPQRMSREEYTRKVRAAVEERRHNAMVNRQHYQPQVHEQIQRLFSEYEAPFYARMRGFGRGRTLALAESTVLGLAAGTNRRLSDTETQALTEHFLSSVHNMLAWKWIMTGLAGYMTYRGRKKMRFPLFQPVLVGGMFDPVTGGPQVRIMWHTARFAAYYGALWLMGEPVFQGFNFLRQSYVIDRDPRLAPLLRDGKRQAADAFDAAQDTTGQQQGYEDAWKSEPQQQQQQQQYHEFQPDGNNQPTSQTIRAQTQQTWTSYRRQSEPPQQSGPEAWDATTDVDDASPIASSASSQNETPRTYSGSAWDRVRQQSHSAPRQDAAQTTWGSNTSRGWASGDDASPQYRGDRDSYSSSTTTDGEEASGRMRAQREFDELLERERAGADQERGRWGRR